MFLHKAQAKLLRAIIYLMCLLGFSLFSFSILILQYIMFVCVCSVLTVQFIPVHTSIIRVI